MLIREIKPDDAKSLANLIKQVEKESQFMLFESGEVNRHRNALSTTRT